MAFDRYTVVNAFAAFLALHEDDHPSDPRTIRLIKRLDAPGVRELDDVRKPYAYHGQCTERGDVLDNLSNEALAGYFELCDRYLGRDRCLELIDQWRRINSIDGVMIHVENSDDPTMINFHISDPLAHEWSEKHGSLAGGTWESADGPDYVYDSTYWHKDLFPELEAEGYDFDFSTYSEPDEDDLQAAQHAAECDECQYDHAKAVEHLAEELEATAKRKLAK
jgi:hypothetical protein